MFKKLLSYLWPITKIMPSEYSGDLEVTWYDGKKLLDSPHANYSYGNLQKILVYGLKKIDFEHTEPALVLGMGGGSVIVSLREEFNYQNHITAVEIDPKVIDLAKREFGISQNDKLSIECEDAFAFVKDCEECFGLVIVDLFIDDRVPEKFYGKLFWGHLRQVVSPTAHVLFNAGVTDRSDLFVAAMKRNLSQSWHITEFKDPGKTNRLLILRPQKPN